MAIFEDSGTLKYKDKAGNLHIMKPRTTSGNVEGLTQLLAEKENSGAAATALENAKAYTDQNISDKLDKPVNDATATAGQLLTKTANGQEWQDREKDLFIVTFTYNGKYHADKTFAEIKAAYDEGKMCYASLNGNICLRGVITNSYVTFIAFDVWGSSESISTSMGFIRIYSGNSIVSNAIRNQPFVTASGLLKGDGDGGVSAAVAGTDYVAPNGDGSNVTAAFTAASTRANVATGEKLSVLFGKIAKWFADLGSLAFKSTVAKSDLASDVQTSLGKADSAFADKVSKSGDTMTGKLTVPQVETGDGNSNFFQCRKFRGEGDANTYYHAVDFGYKNHDQVDFHEYGGKWNFYKNQSGKVNEGVLCGSITSNGWEGHAKLKSGSTMVTSQLTENSDAIATTAFVHGLVDTVNVPTVPSTTSLLKGDGSGGLVAASRGSDYIASGNIVKQTLVSTETTPTEDYAINWVYG